MGSSGSPLVVAHGLSCPAACGILLSQSGTEPAPPAVEGRVLTTRPPGYCGCSVTQSCPTLCDSIDCSTLGLPVLHHCPEFAQTHVHWVSDAIQACHPMLSPSPLSSIFPSIGVFSNESVLRIRLPKNWSFSFSISPSNEYSGLISFRMDWLDLLAVQGTLKSLLPMYITIREIDLQSRFDVWVRVLRAGELGGPEGWDGEGRWRGVQDGGPMYTHGWLMSMYGKNHYNIVK